MKERKHVFYIDKKSIIDFLLALLLCSGSINYCLKAICWRCNINQDIPFSLYIQIVIFIIYVFICNRTSIVRLHRFPTDIAVIVAWFLIGCTISFIANGSYGLLYDNTILWLFGNGVFSYILIRCYNNFEQVIHYFSSMSFVFGVVSIVCFLLTRNVVDYASSPDKYMFFSSSMFSLVIGLYIKCKSEKKNIWSKVVLIILLLISFTYGARGFVAQIIIFYFAYLLLGKKYKSMIITLIIVIGLICIFPYIIQSSVVKELAYRSRTISKLLKGTLLDDGGRFIFYQKSLEYFWNKPLICRLFGLGIAGERYYIANNLTKAGYAHNFFIEIILHYGVIGATFISIFISAILIRTVRIIQGYGDSNMILFFSFLIASISGLMVSGSYLSSKTFFLFLGFSIGIIVKYREHKEYLAKE